MGVLVFLPILDRLKPRFAKWFRLRYWPEPLDFQPTLWIHAVSVGEVNIARAFLAKAPGLQNILLTTATQAGFSLIRKVYGDRQARYLPWDLPKCYRRLFGAYDPPHMVVVETEVWPYLFEFVTGHGSKVAIVNGRLGTRALRFKGLGLYQLALSHVTKVAARSNLDRDRFGQFELKANQLAVTGNMKFDFVPPTLAAGPLRSWLAAAEPLVIFASLSQDEVVPLLPQLEILLEKIPELKVLWAPRHLETLDRHLSALTGLNPVLRSELEAQSPRLVVLDSFGELAGCYAFADLSIIGGSFNQRGGQNFLESLQAGTPVLIGPSVQNIRREVAEASKAESIIHLKTADQLAPCAMGLLEDDAALREMSQRAQGFLAKHRGAIARTLNLLIDLEMINRNVLEDL